MSFEVIITNKRKKNSVFVSFAGIVSFETWILTIMKGMREWCERVIQDCTAVTIILNNSMIDTTTESVRNQICIKTFGGLYV